MKIVREGFPDGYDAETLYESLRHLAGVVLTDDILKDTAHRLCGNMPRLLRRRAVQPWSVQPFPEWVPTQIMSCRRRTEHGMYGADFTFKILAGTSCPLLIRRWWSHKYCRYLARHLGFSRPPGKRVIHAAKYPFSAVEQLVTFRMYVLIDPDLCRHAEPMFEKVKIPPSVMAWNRQQLKHRFRVDPGYVCPEEFPRSHGCHQCSLGYLSCRAGTHMYDYELKPCSYCKELEAPFDPAWVGAVMCINCHNREQQHAR